MREDTERQDRRLIGTGHPLSPGAPPRPAYEAPKIYRVRYVRCEDCGISDKIIRPRELAWDRGCRPECPKCGRPMNVSSAPRRKKK